MNKIGAYGALLVQKKKVEPYCTVHGRAHGRVVFFTKSDPYSKLMPYLTYVKLFWNLTPESAPSMDDTDVVQLGANIFQCWWASKARCQVDWRRPPFGDVMVCGADLLYFDAVRTGTDLRG
jgi:hypothetical protein